MWVILRLIIGSVFIAAGAAKLMSPYQNFEYVIQAYQLMPLKAEVVVAQVFPWIELTIGVFVFLGLWTSKALGGAWILFGTFVVVVGQALLRGLPLENCGCFGEWIHLKPQMVIVMDSCSLLLVLLVMNNLASAKKFSLDSFFDKV